MVTLKRKQIIIVAAVLIILPLYFLYDYSNSFWNGCKLPSDARSTDGVLFSENNIDQTLNNLDAYCENNKIYTGSGKEVAFYGAGACGCPGGIEPAFPIDEKESLKQRGFEILEIRCHPEFYCETRW